MHQEQGGDTGHRASPGGGLHWAGAQVGPHLRPGHPRGRLRLRVRRPHHH